MAKLTAERHVHEVLGDTDDPRILQVLRAVLLEGGARITERDPRLVSYPANVIWNCRLGADRVQVTSNEGEGVGLLGPEHLVASLVAKFRRALTA